MKCRKSLHVCQPEGPRWSDSSKRGLWALRIIVITRYIGPDPTHHRSEPPHHLLVLYTIYGERLELLLSRNPFFIRLLELKSNLRVFHVPFSDSRLWSFGTTAHVTCTMELRSKPMLRRRSASRQGFLQIRKNAI